MSQEFTLSKRKAKNSQQLSEFQQKKTQNLKFRVHRIRRRSYRMMRKRYQNNQVLKKMNLQKLKLKTKKGQSLMFLKFQNKNRNLSIHQFDHLGQFSKNSKLTPIHCHQSKSSLLRKMMKKC